MYRLWLSASLVLSIAAMPVARVHAQDQGVAVITSPLEGATISGLVPIIGTAAHPQFQRYELAFGYSPNPTDTWFSIQDPATTQVVNDVIGRWDTSGITDGVYSLRLRVYWTERSFLEAVVQNVHLQNATPTPPPPEATAPPPLPTPTPEITTPTATLPLIVLPPTSTPRPTLGPPVAGGNGSTTGAASRLNTEAVQSAFIEGVRLTLIVFVLLGAYAGLRAALRR
jgi:hypothetical protein